MSSTTLERLFDAIDAAKQAGDAPRAARLLHDALSDPALEELYSRGSVADELIDLHVAAGDASAAEAVLDRAAADGWFTPPYARVRRAALHLATGDLGAALRLYDEARADREQPVTDVHVLYEAGVLLDEAGEHERAVVWLGDGIRVSIEQHDAEGLLEEMVEVRLASLEALGRQPDTAQRAAATHLRAHARYQRPTRPQERVAVAYFPPSEYEHARRVWPDLRDVFLDTYDAYAAVVEKQLRGVSGHPRLVPLTVDEYLAWCRDRARDAGAANVRAAYAAEVADRAATPWPPGRNDPCWCGSDRKYKKCHGSG